MTYTLRSNCLSMDSLLVPEHHAEFECYFALAVANFVPRPYCLVKLCSLCHLCSRHTMQPCNWFVISLP